MVAAADLYDSKDLKDLRTYQQLFVYFVPLITNVGFINAFVVAVRLFWFEKRLRNAGASPIHPIPSIDHSLTPSSSSDI